MKVLLLVLASLVFALASGLSDAWMFKERAPRPGGQRYSRLWHGAQAVQQATFIAALGIFGDWQIIPLAAGLFWLIHDVVVNIEGLNRDWLYVGSTAWIDRQFQKTGTPRAWMLASKLGLIAAGAVLLAL